MLRPQDNVAREARRLDGLWDFTIDPDGRRPRRALVAEPARRRPADARCRPATTTCSSTSTCTTTSATSGTSGTVFVPPGGTGDGSIVRFDAACHRAMVWFDDEQVAEHEGGYTPFEADVTASRPTWSRTPDHGRR